MQKPKPQFDARWLVLLVSLWLASVGNVALWSALWHLPEISGSKAIPFLLCFFVFIAALQAAFLSVFSWRWSLKPAIAFCLVAAALGANFMMAYGVVIDRTMMVNVLQTDLHESTELLSVQLVLMLGFMALLPLLVLRRVDVRHPPFLTQARHNVTTLVLALLVGVAAVMLTFQSMASVMRNHKQIRFMINPLNSFYALGEIALEPFTHPKLPMVAIGEDAQLGDRWQAGGKPPLLILVVGETARAANFSLNGYARETNPELARSDVVSFQQVYSCGTSTAASIPCMFSHLGRADYDDREADYETLLDVLQHSGLQVLWRDNNSGCKNTCLQVPHEDVSHLKDPMLCSDKECLDEILLQHLDESISGLANGEGARGVVVVLHQKGSHGPAYYLRSPKAFKKFLPECETNILQDCTREQVVNAYDNTILYTDHVLAQTIDWLKARGDRYATAMLYVSDHGESLGENNTYLHGLPYMLAPDVQTHVPMVAWLSPQMQQSRGITMQCLSERKNDALTHDHLFHSVLGILDVQTSFYRSDLDMFASCSNK